MNELKENVGNTLVTSTTQKARKTSEDKLNVRFEVWQTSRRVNPKPTLLQLRLLHKLTALTI